MIYYQCVSTELPVKTQTNKLVHPDNYQRVFYRFIVDKIPQFQLFDNKVIS